MIVMIDNYDSFTYNIVQAFRSMGAAVEVVRNDDAFDLDSACGIVISPGPGYPTGAGVCLEVIEKYHTKLPILGVCLGHQCIAEAFGAGVSRASRIMHGKISRITHDGRHLFCGLPQRMRAVRYHSLSVERESLPACLRECASSEDGEIMAIKHVDYPVFGIQFHPESYATEHGTELMRHFLEAAGGLS